MCIRDRNNALTTRATKTGTIQCFVGSDGAIYAGGGNVQLNSNGLIINASQALLAKFLGVNIGYLLVGSGGFGLEGYTGKNVTLGAYGSGKIYLKGNIRGGSPNGILMSDAEYMLLPRRTSAPSPATDGMMIFNPSTGEINHYSSADGHWWHFQLTSGWA